MEGKGWIEAARLQAGDRLVSHNGLSVLIEEVFDTKAWEVVYNLRVADWHTYFVGSKAWGWSAWAHNNYSGISDNTKIKKGGDFTKSQKRKILEENRRKNGGVLRSDDPADEFYGKDLEQPPKGPFEPGKYPSVPKNQAQVDHIVPKIGKDGKPLGTNAYENARVISAAHNNKLRNNALPSGDLTK